MKVELNFDRFLDNYKAEKHIGSCNTRVDQLPEIEGYSILITKFAGCSFHNGLYRLFEPNSAEKWNQVVSGIFGQFHNGIICFASDWMGRIFAWNVTDSSVLLLDAGFGEAMKIPCDFYQLHNNEFVDYPEESLSKGLFEDCMKVNNVHLNNNECFGYKISPFLGGEDNVANMEVINLEVYWSICEDIYNQVAK